MDFNKSFREILSSQLLALIGGLIAGTFLAVYTDQLLLVPGLFILLPGFLEMRGNISGTLSARLSSGLFLGVIKPNRFNLKIIKGNVLASFFLAIVVALVLGIIAYLFNYLLVGTASAKIILLPLIAGALANIVEISLTVVLTFWLFRKGHDPNNIIGPVLTTAGDVVGVLSLLLALVIL